MGRYRPDSRTANARDAQRSSSRRPIDSAEVPFLEALGTRLAELRVAVGVSQATLAERAELARSTVERIEGGTRRTRRSTLERIAEALDRSGATEELVALVGPALAPESAYADRIEGRRARRRRRGRAERTGTQLLAVALVR